MIESAVVVALLVVSHRLRRASRQPSPPIEFHFHFHDFPGGDPGEREPSADPVPIADNVVPLRRRIA